MKRSKRRLKISNTSSSGQSPLGQPAGFCVVSWRGSLLNIYSCCKFIHICYNAAVGEIMLAPRNGGWPPTRNIARWSSLVARRAHNPKVVGSNPALATNKALAGNGQGFLPSFCHISRARYASLGSGCSTERWLNPWLQFPSPGCSSQGFFFCLLSAESWLLRSGLCLIDFSCSLEPAKAAPEWHAARMTRAAS